MFLLWIIGWILVSAAVGFAWGLIPKYYGRHRGQENRGRWGQILCTVTGPFLVSVLVMLGFVLAIHAGARDGTSSPGELSRTKPAPAAPRGSLTLTCLAGPMQGKVYPVGRDGLMFGRDSDCAVRFPTDTQRVSRHHCAIRWGQDGPVLVDLSSAYGTFLADGHQLTANAPTAVAAGSRFYLAAPSNLFQLTGERPGR